MTSPKHKRLLIFTQVVDLNDPVLGFFHRWIEELSKHCESITVICLREGTHSLPASVRVLSLGKETRASRAQYLLRMTRYLWMLRNDYDAVFVHMNQEYLLLAGWWWCLTRKPAYMWRNFHKGSLLTDIAAFWCKNVFCTSASSYTARYKKTILMPVGIDTDFFVPVENKNPVPHSILSLGRIAPEKHIETLIRAQSLITSRGITDARTDIYGDALPKDVAYLEELKTVAKNMYASDGTYSNRVEFHAGVPNADAHKIYTTHEVFINMSPSGMYDKTIFEAAASGCLVIASSNDWHEATSSLLMEGSEPGATLSFDGSVESLTESLAALLTLSEEKKDAVRLALREMTVRDHSLKALGVRLAAAIYST